MGKEVKNSTKAYADAKVVHDNAEKKEDAAKTEKGEMEKATQLLNTASEGYTEALEEVTQAETEEGIEVQRENKAESYKAARETKEKKFQLDMQEKRNKDANKVAQDENSLGRAGNKASLLASKEQDAATKALQQKIKVATLEKAVKQKEGSNQGAALKEAKQKVGTDEGLMQHMMMQFGHVKLSVTEDEEAVK